jgi:xanthine/CO dehydrogenase XdhC/CoxF family maturation factor
MHIGRLGVRLDTSLDALLDWTTPGNPPGILATLVATAGSTYRKPGARMLIRADGSYRGLLSGGCLEADLNLHAREVQDSGNPKAVEYDMRGPDDILFGIGAGCEGAMRVLLEPAGPGSLAAASLLDAGHSSRAGRATVLVMVHEAEGAPLGTFGAGELSARPLADAARSALADGTSREIVYQWNGSRGRAFVQFLAPPPHVLICGAGPDAQPVVAAAVGLGWRVTVLDHRPAYAIAERFPGAQVRRIAPHELREHVALADCHAAVVMSHHLPSDVAYLRELADAGVPPYIGLLGPAARRQRIAQELGPAAPALRMRMRGPVGIDIGAVTPEGIALAIISELHAWLAGRISVMLDSLG